MPSISDIIKNKTNRDQARTEQRQMERETAEQPAEPLQGEITHEQIRVLKVEPGRPPEEVTIPNTLEALQSAVSGYIEALDLDSDAVLLCNEEGKLLGLPANRRVNGDTIAGTFLIVGSADGDFCSLSEEDMAYYDREFAQPMPSFGECDGPTQWEFYVL